MTDNTLPTPGKRQWRDSRLGRWGALALVLWIGALACRGVGGGSLSPGPGGWLTGEDLRVPVEWMVDGGVYGEGDYARTLRIDGRERYYELHVPPTYRPGTETPAILVLHGGGGFPGVMRFMTGMSELSDETGGFLVVYPAGTNARYKDRQLYWNAGWEHKSKKQRKVDDIAYFTAVLDDLSEHFTVDEDRVYATGISNGAHMTFRLASELSSRIAAIATVGGQISPGQLGQVPPRPVPLIHFHGREDRWNPWAGGSPPKSSFTNVALDSVPEVVAAWAEHNRCAATPARRELIGAATGTFYEPTMNGARTVLWELEDGGHTWPGGRATAVERTGKIGVFKVAESVGHVNTDVSASRLMWNFFEQHSLTP